MKAHHSEASSNASAPQNGNISTEKLRVGPLRSTRREGILSKFQKLGSQCVGVWSSFKHYWQERKRTQKPPGKKPPFNLDFWGLLLLLIFEVLILITITVLWILTMKRNGFVDVPDTPSSLIGNKTFHERILWAMSLLWTFIPAFVVSMCGKLFGETLTSLEECQPTIELRQQGNSTAKHSILLDYGSYKWPFVDSYHALRNKHFLICICTVVKWFFAFVGPLASAIISIASVPATKSVQVTTNTFFDDWKDQSSTRPALEIASAVLLNSGSPYAWSTKMYSVVPFVTNTETAGNLTAKTGTYSATLDCVPIDVDSLLSAGNITLGSYNSTDFNFVDRGCAVSPWINITPDPPLYSETFYENCPYAAGQVRLVLMTGKYDDSSPFQLGNFSLISCIPQFWNSTSKVTVLSGSNGQILDVVPDTPAQSWWPEFATSWLWNIPSYRIQDAKQTLDADNFGYIAYNLAKSSNGTNDFVQAMNATFSAVFAIFATLSTYSESTTSQTLPATLSQPGNRLFVVSLQATIVTIVMALSLVVTLWVVIFAHQHKNILKEHSDLILGHAILLEGNKGVSTFITKTKEDFGKQVDVANKAKTGKKGWKAMTKADIDLVVKDGDLVKYAEDAESLNGWNCGVDGEGKLWMTKPVPATQFA